ncbi:hypothetical protein Y032_0306g1972 [Ancylostoma ceylanicum]|uniref:Uncharacterized protein n=1 Tax=Ancylostoma ceylanicum TaxID=53326 RepID=A0A016S386_9BILA|nr:hypothetical protein Y032_0306g1972 [Ancylostoma ceylanicum]
MDFIREPKFTGQRFGDLAFDRAPAFDSVVDTQIDHGIQTMKITGLLAILLVILPLVSPARIKDNRTAHHLKLIHPEDKMWSMERRNKNRNKIFTERKPLPSSA